MRHGLSPEFLDPEEIAGLQSRKSYHIHMRNQEEGRHMISKFIGLQVWATGGVLLLVVVTNTSLSSESATCGRCGAPAISASKKLCHSCLEELNQNVMKQKQVRSFSFYLRFHYL